MSFFFVSCDIGRNQTIILYIWTYYFNVYKAETNNFKFKAIQFSSLRILLVSVAFRKIFRLLFVRVIHRNCMNVTVLKIRIRSKYGNSVLNGLWPIQCNIRHSRRVWGISWLRMDSEPSEHKSHTSVLNQKSRRNHTKQWAIHIHKLNEPALCSFTVRDFVSPPYTTVALSAWATSVVVQTL
jgi:hypothetical protein